MPPHPPLLFHVREEEFDALLSGAKNCHYREWQLPYYGRDIALGRRVLFSRGVLGEVLAEAVIIQFLVHSVADIESPDDREQVLAQLGSPHAIVLMLRLWNIRLVKGEIPKS